MQQMVSSDVVRGEENLRRDIALTEYTPSAAKQGDQNINIEHGRIRQLFEV
jgi:hypothetical protein